jgi:uncharacterized Zn finger protein
MAWDDYPFYGFRPHVTVRSRQADASRELARLRKAGRAVAPVIIDGRTIARTFWGKAWCDNLERYSDYANRLPRGRSYVRSGSVLDLQVEAGRVTALVSGSRVYDVKVTVEAVAAGPWQAICRDCSGAIDSLVGLLQGHLSGAVMARLCEPGTGLFPSPKEILFTCSCPDGAWMCKHVAAVLYGIGARLDHQPELLFRLRRVDQEDLIAKAGTHLSQTRKPPASARVLVTDDLSQLFGIDIAPPALASAPVPTPAPTPTPSPVTARPAAAKKPKPARPREPRRLTTKQRQAIVERMRRYWAERRAQATKPKAVKR